MCYSADLHSPVLSPAQKWVCQTSPCKTQVSVTAGIRPLTARVVKQALGPCDRVTVGPLREAK